jgi:hypothetical protein
VARTRPLAEIVDCREVVVLNLDLLRTEPVRNLQRALDRIEFVARDEATEETYVDGVLLGVLLQVLLQLLA